MMDGYICCNPDTWSNGDTEVMLPAVTDALAIYEAPALCPHCRKQLGRKNLRYCTFCGNKMPAELPPLSFESPGTLTDRYGGDPQAMVPVVLCESEPPPGTDRDEQHQLLVISKMEGVECINAEVEQQKVEYLEDVADALKARADTGHEGEAKMEVVFWYKGEETTKTFRRKPLGLRWHLKPPIKIDQVLSNSHAEEQGVKKGWVVKAIDGWDCTGQSYGTLTKTLQTAIKSLPWEQNKKDMRSEQA